MPINTKQLIELIIQPTLKELGLYSLAAEQLLAGTCEQESLMGTYLAQFPKPIAKGLWQMENATHDDIHRNFLHGKELRLSIYKACKMPEYNLGVIPDAENMIWNLKYACAMARIHYLRVKEPLPHANDIPAMAAYWKKHYNTHLGKGKESEFIANWNKYCASYYGDK